MEKYKIDQEDLNRIEFIKAESLEEAREKINDLIGLINVKEFN